MAESRDVTDGVQCMGVGESITYSVTLKHTPTLINSVVIQNLAGLVDVTGAAMPSGSATNSGPVVTVPEIVGSALTVNQIYRVLITYQYNGNTLESYFRVLAER